ncbi:MFS transporter [Micromonospora echinofusca]|uniref:MFS transporter n=1 Tax=Micromonospora echinofusca TaxID=47858 RepID=A0ABS3VUJ9_MICEH|nr:MFS transporter [Micromonospora echinofusca]MBO4208069.1 MFS transporter [Micromonospora echinofusca]
MSALRRWLHDTAGGLPATFWYLWSGLLINRAGAFVVLFLSLYLSDVRDASTALTGLVVGAYGAGGAVGVLLGGVLADRWGRRATLLWSHVASGATMVALAVTGNLLVIAVLATLLGVVHSMPSPAYVAAIIDVVPPERRSRAFNLQFWAFNLGMAVASLLAGVLAEASYLALFLVDAGAALTTAVLIAWKVPETLARSRRGAATGGVRPGGATGGGLRTALTDRTFLVFVGLTFVLAVLTTQTSTILPLSIRADGLGPSAYGLVVAVGGALIVLGQLFVPRLLDGHRKHRVLAVSTGLMGVGFGALAFADGLPLYLAACVTWTIGSMLAAPPNAEINAELAPAPLRARYQSVFYLTFPAAAFVAPTLGGVSLQYLGDGHWIVVGGVGLLAVVGHLLAGPPRERRVAALWSPGPPGSPGAPGSPAPTSSGPTSPVPGGGGRHSPP